jgi:hypothetical protein
MERVLVNNWSMREDGWIGEHCVIMSSAEEIVVDVS